MTRAVRSAGMLLAATVMVSIAGCTAEDGSNEGAGSCAAEFSYQGRMYRDVANVDFTVADKLGTATDAPCGDTGKDDAENSGSTETAYAVDGISPKVAIAVGDTPEDARLVVSYSGSDLPPEVKKLINGS
ncbi:DUF6281 family protein [Streptomyces sp. NPDC002055]|uniref:DUF6281 family protein n=1 Tax=Streptomyces sp. NPDC002055 TaxID=3154534 RepID=UPI0033336ADD